MSQKRIENQIQNKLVDYSSIIDEDQLWSSIEGRIPQKKKKRRFFFWLLFGLPLLGVGIIGIWIFSDASIGNKTEGNQFIQIENQKTDLEKREDVAISRTSENQLKTLVSKQNSASTIKNKKRTNSDQITQQKVKKGNFENENKIIAEIENPQGVNFSIREHKNLEVLSDKELVFISSIPSIEFLPMSDEILRPKIRRKRTKRRINVAPLKKADPFIAVNYYSGKYIANEKLSNQEERVINFGEAYFSQGLSFSFNHFITNRLHGRVIFAVDQSYRKYSDRVSRDTIVPSSTGAQTVSYNQYLNGVIDTEFGIPQVNGTVSRDIINNNSITSVGVGLGLGYVQPIGKINVHFEADVQRTIYYSLNGLGRENNTQKIRNLDSFQDYFSDESKYSINTQMNVDFSLSKTLLLTAGFQYQLGLNSILIEQTNHSEKMNLIRGSIGLKRQL